MMDVLEHIVKSHASIQVKYYALYAIYFLGIDIQDVAFFFGKTEATIRNWVKRFEKHGHLEKKKRVRVIHKVTDEQRNWILAYYRKRPISFLSETKEAYAQKWGETVSESTVWRVLHPAGLSCKVRQLAPPFPVIAAGLATNRQELECRAINVRFDDIIRFFLELQSTDWDLFNLVFLDEVSLDNRGMRRTHGYGESGKRLFVNGEYVRLPRVPLLCFLTHEGLLDAVPTEGTFTRDKFFECCEELVHSGYIQAYPGPRSIWIMDGAKIHRHRAIIDYLRTAGIVVLFLPAYCPFYNPIEIFFGLLKGQLRRTYPEGKLNAKTIQSWVMQTLAQYDSCDFSPIMRHCGYVDVKKFDPDRNYQPGVFVLPEQDI